MKKIWLVLILVLTLTGSALAGMRVCVETATGKLIESQSGGEVPPINPKWTPAEIKAATVEYRKQNLQTLIDNAARQGYSPGDIEAKFISDSEFDAILNSRPPSVSQIQEQKIQLEIRSMAIKNLKDAGVLPTDYIDPRSQE